MKKFIALIFFLSILAPGKSQNLDLIVRSNNDSIACHIDSITDSHVYFEMRQNGHWINLYIDKNELLDYKYDAIDKNAFLFKQGTSYILGPRIIKSVYEIRKNAVYVEIGGKGILVSVNYDRLLPLTDRSGIILGCTIGFLGDFVPEINYLYGKSKNFIEIGLGYSFPEQLLVPQVGYRYQGSKGLLFRIGGMYFASTLPESFGDFPWVGLSFGYSF